MNMRTAEEIILDIDRIDAILDKRKKEMMDLRQKKQMLFDELVQLNRHDAAQSTS